MKKTQNYSNHARLVPSYHYFTFLLIIALITLTSIYCFTENKNASLFYAILILLTTTIISIGLHTRTFALKAQDRAIRAEENLRYFILTGKRLDQNLKMSQIIALRFASDEELVELVERAIQENLSAIEIKKAIKNWKGDYYRV
jgi:hypothetical protein